MGLQGGGSMRRAGLFSIILILIVSPLFAGCGSSPPAVQKPTWRDMGKPFGEMDTTTRAIPPEVADYPEVTEAAALQLFRTCQEITGLGFSQEEWPVNIVKSFEPEEYCNAYTIADSWLFMTVRTSDARITSLKNCQASRSPGVVQGLAESDALLRTTSLRAAFDAAEEMARQASPGVANRQQLLYYKPFSMAWQVTADTGCWYFFWERVKIYNIPYHQNPMSFLGEGIRLTQRVDGLFLEYTTQETVESRDTKPAISSEAAQATAQPLIDDMLAYGVDPALTQKAELAYVIPGDLFPRGAAFRDEPEPIYQRIAYPNEFRLAWVVSVGPHPWHTELNWAEVWIDALTGEIIGGVDNNGLAIIAQVLWG